MMQRRETGILGEKLTCDFLGNNGYQIIERNFRYPRGEAYIVSWQQNTLVFIKVRTKSSRLFDSREESITPAKMAKLRTVAVYYRQSYSNLPEIWHLDVVAIEMDSLGRVSRIELIESAMGDEG